MIPNNNQPLENAESQPTSADGVREKQRAEAAEPLKPSPAPRSQTQNNQPADLSALQQTSPPTQPLQQPADNNTPAQSAGISGKGSEPYIKAAENVMEKDKDDPYQEEEDHEDVQIQYLHDRFGKDIKKGQ